MARLRADFPEVVRKHHSSFITEMRLLYFAILYRVSDSARKEVLDQISFFERQDPIIQSMAQFLEEGKAQTQGYKSSLDPSFPNLYSDLWESISASTRTKRVSLANQYLSSWYSKNKRTRTAGLGIDSHEKMILYRGYWCWEIAAAVLMTDMDSSDLRDHVHYPGDLIEWSRSHGWK